MFSPVLSLIVGLVVVGILWWAAGLLPLPALVAQILSVVFILAVVALLIDFLCGLTGWSRPWRGRWPGQ